MKKLTLLLLLAITSNCFAQQDTTLVYNSPMYTKDPIRAKWRPVVKRNGEFFQVTFYDSKDVIQEIVSFEDRNLEVRKGFYERYLNGKLKEKGSYDKGHKHGEWFNYNLTDQKIAVENFTYGKLDGKYVKYWDSQQIQEEGNYNANKKAGNWKLFYEDGKTAGEETYDNEGKKAESKYYDKSGRIAQYEELFAKPTYKGGIKEFYTFLASEIEYPRQAAKLGITGSVKLRFMVKKTGGIEDITVEEAPNADLASEAVRVLQMSSSGWKPARTFGEAVNVKYYIPIKFSLPRSQ